MGEDKYGAAVKIPPLLIFVVMLGLGYGLHTVNATGLGILSGFRYWGIVLLIVAVIILVHAFDLFSKANTNMEPWKPTSSIISTGVYAYSRNPIYLSFCLIAMGIGLLLNSFWIFISFVPIAMLIYNCAISREERYLELKFGKEYCDYKSLVRRWL